MLYFQLRNQSRKVLHTKLFSFSVEYIRPEVVSKVFLATIVFRIQTGDINNLHFKQFITIYLTFSVGANHGWWPDKFVLPLIKVLTWIELKMGHSKRKRVFELMRTANAQISRCIRTLCVRPSLPASRIIGYYRMYRLRANAQILWACAE